MHYDAFGRHSDPTRTYFLEGLPDLDLPSHNQSRRKQRQEADPLREAARKLPQWGDHWPEVRNRFNAARGQVFMYFTDPKIKALWREHIMEVAASAGSTRLFPELPEWSDGKSKVYATMAICTQLFTPETLMPKSVQETSWYKLNHDVYEWVRAWDAAPGWMIHIEQDLRERGLLDHVGKTETAGGRKRKITLADTNTVVCQVLKETLSWDWTVRNLTAEVKKRLGGGSQGLIAKCPAWKAYNERRDRVRKDGTIKTVSLTSEMEAVLGAGDKDEIVDQLIAEQEGDLGEDAKQAKLYLSHEKKPKRRES